MDKAELALRFLRVLLSWPTVGLVVGLVTINVFKEPFSDFLRRIVKGQAYGVQVEATKPNSQVQEGEEVEDETEALAESTDDDHEAIEYVRENPEEAVEELVRYHNGYKYEKYYNIIYGSQISLLEHLADMADDGDMYINLRPWYQEHLGRADYEGSPIQMAEYLQFLDKNNLIKAEEDGNGNLNVKITSEGLNFLSYIKSEYPADYLAKSF